ncbi:hypothetical protein [Actinoallomurus iriomotensis]|uniref:Uncharacterized protein n=1 Tax=Actinoallomurus iriomotensis TaxID=478107 RepID=A0A9W6S1G4_9ACTN|nr:hypothetical protein [Actinoallomurus iriomotensis]GLY85503.1 hypothetical protein Airi02_034320 [Actinoallomurus iriomotensis]
MDRWERSRRRARDAGLAAVTRWTRRAVAAGVVLSGVLGMGLAHLLPGQAAPSDVPSPAGTGDPSGGRASASPPAEPGRPRLTPPHRAPRPSHRRPHATSGGS